MASVEISRRALDVENRNVGRQQIIETAFDQVRGLPRPGIHFHVHDLSQRVHSGIGSSCALHIDVAHKYLLCRLLNLAHDRAGILLRLPAAVASAVVFQGDLESRHDVSVLNVL